MRNIIGASAIAITAIVALASGTAQAVVYRCEDGGKVIYSDRPCGDGAKPLAPTVGAKPVAPKAGDEREQVGDLARRKNDVAPCVERLYNAWYAQHKAKPSKGARDAKLVDVRDQCRKDAGLPPLR